MTKFSEVAHLYIGCEVEFGFEGSKKIGKLVGKVEPFGLHVFDPSRMFVPYHNVRDELIKPLLRHLSDMTEEEAWECWRSCDGGSGHNYAVTNPKSALIDFSFHARLSPMQWFEVTRYLLSRSFDLFGLIESGQAIDKTKKS